MDAVDGPARSRVKEYCGFTVTPAEARNIMDFPSTGSEHLYRGSKGDPKDPFGCRVDKRATPGVGGTTPDGPKSTSQWKGVNRKWAPGSSGWILQLAPTAGSPDRLLQPAPSMKNH